MKGKIIKTDQGWMVEHNVYERTPIGHKSWWEILPLHPDDVKQINKDAQVFDNIEARIAAYPDVEFEMMHLSVDPLGRDITTYAKLVNN